MNSTFDLSAPENRTLGKILQLHAASDPEKPFLLSDDLSLSYGETNARSNQIARGFQQRGVVKGDRIVFFMESRAEYVVVALAAAKVGIVWVPISTDYKGDWLIDSINDSDAKLIVTSQAYEANIKEVANALSCQDWLCLEDIFDQEGQCTQSFSTFSSEDMNLDQIGYGDTSAILWTSGTTGRPKGVMQPHNAWVRSAESGLALGGSKEGDVFYNVMPLYNSGAWTANVLPALVGGYACAMDPSFSVNTFWDRIRHFNATRTITLGAMHIFLWKQPENPEDANNPLRTANMIPMPDELIEPFCERFGMEDVTQGYGQSECMIMIARNSKKPWPPGALGDVYTGLTVDVLDDQGNAVEVGEVGEICVRPETEYAIFNGYFNNPEATAGAFFDDWYRTGDLGKRDPEGNFYFVDRKNDFIRYKGRNISSMQVEGVALKHPEVEQAACIGIASAELASEAEIKLDIVKVSNSALTEEDLARFINDNAPYYFVPRYVEFRESLPYTPTNKVQKYKLREMGLSANAWDRSKNGFEVKR